jgi:hypothetical protein
MRRPVPRRWWQAAIALAVAFGATVTVSHLATPPATETVAFLTASVPQGDTIPASAVTWQPVVTPPTGALTWPERPLGPVVATVPLYAGQALTPADFTPASQAGLRPGEVAWLVPVSSAAASGLPNPGQRVDLWGAFGSGSASGSSPAAPPVLIATGVRVLGLYTSQGVPISLVGALAPAAAPGTSGLSGQTTAESLSSSGASIGIVELAIPRADLGSLMAASNFSLVVDPGTSHFRLALPTASTGPTVPGA